MDWFSELLRAARQWPPCCIEFDEWVGTLQDVEVSPRYL